MNDIERYDFWNRELDAYLVSIGKKEELNLVIGDVRDGTLTSSDGSIKEGNEKGA